jgi:hypothetical protein
VDRRQHGRDATVQGAGADADPAFPTLQAWLFQACSAARGRRFSFLPYPREVGRPETAKGRPRAGPRERSQCSHWP